jgi:hypothetical protein
VSIPLFPPPKYILFLSFFSCFWLDTMNKLQLQLLGFVSQWVIPQNCVFHELW